MKLLDISDLRVTFRSPAGNVRALDSVDISLDAGDSCALVGESGSGKTVLGMAIMRLLPSNAIVEGMVHFGGLDLASLGDPEMRRIRCGEIGMIPQNSAMALNPVLPIGRQVTESLVLHLGISQKEAEVTVLTLLHRMGIPDTDHALKQYPHEFSGGMRERVLVAMVLACNPQLIIADEPTSGLDILVRHQMLGLLREQSRDKALLLITHDLGSAHVLCRRIAVMYAGEIVESGPTEKVLSMPMHPYTQGLLASIPSAGLHPIPGMSPSPGTFPAGCRFCDRCHSVFDRCRVEHPPLKTIDGIRLVRCHRYG
ncbi:MAG TPA: ABC transporter ATP-binding protein [Methanoregulaceae archaeon]|nr:ABC transporter ATP-binding protein [Methanoregulaceae archaeon]